MGLPRFAGLWFGLGAAGCCAAGGPGGWSAPGAVECGRFVPWLERGRLWILFLFLGWKEARERSWKVDESRNQFKKGAMNK